MVAQRPYQPLLLVFSHLLEASDALLAHKLLSSSLAADTFLPWPACAAPSVSASLDADSFLSSGSRADPTSFATPGVLPQGLRLPVSCGSSTSPSIYADECDEEEVRSARELEDADLRPEDGHSSLVAEKCKDVTGDLVRLSAHPAGPELHAGDGEDGVIVVVDCADA